jgi:hypothetical protein
MSQSRGANVIDMRNGRRYGVCGTWFGEGLRYEGGFVVVSSDSGETVRIPIERARITDSRLGRWDQRELHDSKPAPVVPPAPVSVVPAGAFFEDSRRSIECANGHAPVNMVQLNFDYFGRWHQCPRCLTRRFVTPTAILDEATAERAIASERERLERCQAELAEQARREAQERASQKAQQREEQRRLQLGVESKGLTNLRIAIVASLACWAVVLVWAELNVRGGLWYFLGGGAAAAVACHWWLVVERWDAAWDADGGPLGARANRLRVVLVAVAFVCAISLGVLLISTFGKAPLGVSVALFAGLLYFGFVSPYLARYHLGY